LWRQLDIEYRNPYRNMAVDEALLIAVDRNIAPNTLHFWRNLNAVVVGRSQSIEKEVSIEACKKYGTSVVRRFTGGGAVYQDQGNLNWTVVLRRDHPLAKVKGILEVFKVFSSPILDGIKTLEIRAEFKPPNSIFVGDKKISGMAAHIKREAILCHGTLLVNTDLNRLTGVLKLVKNKVTNLHRELDMQIPMAHIKRAIITGFNSVHGIKVNQGKLSRKEIEIIKRLYENKYATEEWNTRANSHTSLC
jgi:lipoate-protein ligase A